jgi:hypothetical protein
VVTPPFARNINKTAQSQHGKRSFHPDFFAAFVVMPKQGQDDSTGGSPELPANFRRAVPRPSGRLGLLRSVWLKGYEVVRRQIEDV